MSCSVHLTEEPSEVTTCSSFYKFERMRRTVAHINRFVEYCRGKAIKLPLLNSHVTHVGLNKIENANLRLVQQDEFPEGMIHLRKAQKLLSQLNQTSSIHKLSLFIDETAVTQMDNRITGVIFVPLETKFDIILPKGHRLTKLVVEWHRCCYIYRNI